MKSLREEMLAKGYEQGSAYAMGYLMSAIKNTHRHPVELRKIVVEIEAAQREMLDAAMGDARHRCTCGYVIPASEYVAGFRKCEHCVADGVTDGNCRYRGSEKS
jgi:hypothetical protein